MFNSLIKVNLFFIQFIYLFCFQYWLDSQKPIYRQLSLDLKNPKMYFGLKFYTPEPNKLEDQLTRLIKTFLLSFFFCYYHFNLFSSLIFNIYLRYLFSLQIKKDLSNGILQCNENTAALMASYIIQAEVGDFNPKEYCDHNYVSKFKLIPRQDSSFEWKVMENHKHHM